jgi:hypothetical protein
MASLTNLSDQEKQRAQLAEQQRNATQDYLGGIEDPLAQGLGGYNAAETAGIELTPEQQQQIVTGAGISAGVQNQAAVGAAERAAAAAGGNPAALATYRARAAQQGGAAAGDAMTQARIAASNTAAQREQTIGNARLGQQDQALNYYGGLQQEQNQNAQNEYGRQAQATTTAAQLPSTFDKIVGAVAGGLGGLKKLGDGGIESGGTPAVVGEAGPEKIIDLKSGPSGPNNYYEDGGIDLTPSGGYELYPDVAIAESAPPVSAPTSWLQRLKMAAQQPQQPMTQQPWSKVTPYQEIGEAAGNIAHHYLEDGGMPQGRGGIFTQPTEVRLQKNEAVVPLSYRAGAKTRPSMAKMPAAKTRQPYKGQRG